MLDLDIRQGLAVIEYARKQEQREEYKHEWDAVLPVMHAGLVKLTEFPDYMDMRTGANIDQRPTEVIMAELDRRLGRTE